MQTPLAIGASLLAVLIWLISRRRPQLASGTGRPAASLASSAALTQVLRQGSRDAAPTPGSQPAGLAARLTGPQRLRQLRRAMGGPPVQRLAVLEQLVAQPDRACLPVLQLGLRDPHPAVVRAAAEAMASFRGRTAAPAATQPGPAAVRRLPHNAAPRG
ncbi:MAG: HEAT repeat domain-containing protein [Cyanobacteria bacterium M_surface_9_m1_291]|nr:HEAT repeat domain-containing protein [Cyanobacteria bacterium M_surface_9_m1_291]